MRTQRHRLAVKMTIFAVLSISVGAEEQKNLVDNGDMESTTVSGWTANKPEEAICAITSVDAPTKKGKRALLLQGTGSWMSANSKQVPINPGGKYRAAAWVRTKKGQARIQFDHFENGKWLGARSDTVRVTKDEWTRVSVVSDNDKYPRATHVSIGIVSDGPEVEVYVDDVAMTAVTGDTEQPNKPDAGDGK